MRNKLLLSILVMLFVGAFGTNLMAQTKKKGAKKTTSGATTGAKKTSGKKGKKGAKDQGGATATDPGAATTATPPPPAAEPKPEEPAEDTGVAAPNLVADSSATSFNFDNITLDSVPPVDGFYKATTLMGARPFPFPKEDKNTIKFYKRIWREIRTSDSENRIFAIPGESLMALIMEAVKRGKLIAYADEGFKTKVSYKTIMKGFTDSTIVPVSDSEGNQIGTRTVPNAFNADSITKYELKEDIYFDKVRGKVVTQIISLAPVQTKKNSVGIYVGELHPFYLNFDQCRKLFASKEVVDPQRDLYNVSFDDLFIQRAFKSMIVKESNPADLRIKDKFPDERKQRREAMRIEREIEHYKRSLWKY